MLHNPIKNPNSADLANPSTNPNEWVDNRTLTWTHIWGQAQSGLKPVCKLVAQVSTIWVLNRFLQHEEGADAAKTGLKPEVC